MKKKLFFLSLSTISIVIAGDLNENVGSLRVYTNPSLQINCLNNLEKVFPPRNVSPEAEQPASPRIPPAPPPTPTMIPVITTNQREGHTNPSARDTPTPISESANIKFSESANIK